MNAPVIQLLKRIGTSHGNPQKRDCAMASIYASVLQTPKKRQQRQQQERSKRHS